MNDGNDTSTEKLIAQFDRLIKESKSLLHNKSKMKEWIAECNTKHFPPIVTNEIKNQLHISTPQDIPNAIHTLNDLNIQGTPVIWHKIKDSVYAKAISHCGTMFPHEFIEEGKNLPVEIDYFQLIVANQIASFGTVLEYGALVNLVMQLTNPQYKDRLNEYLRSHPYDSSRPNSFKEKDEPTIHDALNDLDTSLKSSIDSATELLANASIYQPEAFKLAASKMATSNPPFHNRPNSSTFFSQEKVVIGCEPPPGSIVDKTGRTICKKI